MPAPRVPPSLAPPPSYSKRENEPTPRCATTTKTDTEKEAHKQRLDERRAPLLMPDGQPRRRGGPGVGRPVTWVCGGGQDPRTMQRMSLPQLRALFLEIFGQVSGSL